MTQCMNVEQACIVMTVEVARRITSSIEPIARTASMIRTTFLMEQHIGHYSFYQNMRRYIDLSHDIQATWVPITYYEANSWMNWMPLSEGLRGTLVGRKQVERGLRNPPRDIAVFNTQVPASLGFQWLGTTPYVVCTDITPIQYDMMGDHYGHQSDALAFVADAKHRTNQRMFANAAKLLPWSSWTAQSMMDDYHIDSDKIEVVAPGVDLESWFPDESRRLSSLPRILFVGGDFERKGGLLLLDAFRRLPEGSAELHIVTRSKIEPEPGVMIHGEMRPNSIELRELYQSCHIFCMPTLAEAFGLVAIEASASGLPLVTTNVGGLTDVVLDGETGFLIEPGDVEALTDRLGQLIADPERCSAMGRAARRHAESRFNANANNQRLVEILLSIVEETEMNAVNPALSVG